MTQKDKRIEQFFKNPTSLNYFQIQKILLELGFVKIDAKGSHVKFKHSELRYDFIVPVHRNDCKDFYKKLASKLAKTIILNPLP